MVILSPFDTHDTSLEISLRGVQLKTKSQRDHSEQQKKRCLGPQNSSGSSRPEKRQKLVNCATIKETKKLKETMVRVQVELAGGHQYPPGS